ncbi:MAG: hypothetical protein ACRD59_01635 [Candidatus Acidiferrales bacterium]
MAIDRRDDHRHTAPQHGPEGYEHSDANVRSLYRYGSVLAILIVVVMFAMDATYRFFAKIESLGPPASPFENVRVLPPAPRLQPQPGLDLKSYCAAEQQQLSSYGWVDQHIGVVRIPVDRAMAMVLKKGLPARPASQAAADGSAITPVGSAMEPRAMGIEGPCGYLAPPASAEAESK